MESQKIECTIKHYADFLSSLTFLLGFGFVWGHISHASRKLFKILNKMYVYITLPALSYYVAVSITVARYEWDTKHDYVWKMILVDFITKCSLWLVIVLGFMIIYRDRKVLKIAAITAQFVIHGNDIGFSKNLLESTCKMKDNETGHTDDIDFMAIEIPTNLMSFLIFLPLTHGLVGMCKQNNPCFKSFAKNMLRQIGKLSISYLCLIAGVLTAWFTHFRTIPLRLESFQDMIRMSGTLQTLMCGIYIYYLLMNCNWGTFSVTKTLALAGAVTIAYPLLYWIIANFGITKLTDIGNTRNIIILGHASTPASIYIQYYILKHVRCPTNYIAAFLISTILGSLLMYILVIDTEVLHNTTWIKPKGHISPTDYYVHSERWEYILTSILFLLIVAMLIYGRIHTSVLRKLIFIMMLIELLSDLIIGSGGLLGLDIKQMKKYKRAVPLFLSAAGMYNHICVSLLIVVLYLYHKIPQIMRHWKLIISSILLGSLWIPAAIYLGTYFYFKKRVEINELDYCYKSIYFFLDLRIYNTTSDVDIKYPIGAVSYTAINCIIFIMYVIAILFCKTNILRQPDDNQALVEGQVYPDLDKEKFLPCKWMLYYQLTLIIFSISFGIRNINYKDISKTKNDKMFADDILEFLELLSLILGDLAGTYMTLIFCISPGNMDREFVRLMHIPRKIRSFFIKCTEDIDTTSQQIQNAPREDLDRCRKFVLYHKQAFVAHYPPAIIREHVETFTGKDLVRFLIETDVADSPGEAADFGNSYIKGHAITAEEHGALFRNGAFTFIGDDTTYILTPDDQLPNYQDILTCGISQPERPFTYLDY